MLQRQRKKSLNFGMIMRSQKTQMFSKTRRYSKSLLNLSGAGNPVGPLLIYRSNEKKIKKRKFNENTEQ